MNEAQRRECRIARPSTDKERDTPKLIFTSLDLSKNHYFLLFSLRENSILLIINHQNLINVPQHICEHIAERKFGFDDTFCDHIKFGQAM